MKILRTTAGRVALLPLAALAVTGGVLGATAAPADAKTTKTTTVKAIETDFHIALSKKTFSPGKYTFMAINKGQTTHALMITGNGLKMAMTPHISTGQQAKLTVTFKKGAYDIYCPIPGHKALGMNVNIKVAAAVAATTTSTSVG